MKSKCRCPSKWNNITVVDDAGSVVERFEVDELGKLKTKLKTQMRRKIHEGRQTKRTNDHQKASIPKDNDETTITSTDAASIESHTFDLGGLHDPVYPEFRFFQEFSDTTNGINNNNSNEINEINLLNESSDFIEYNEINNPMFLNESENLYDLNMGDIAFIDF